MATVGDVAKIACRLSRGEPTDEDDFNEAVDHVVDAQRFVCGRSDPWDFLQMSGQITTYGGADLYPLSEIAVTFGIAGVKRVLSVVDEEGAGPLRPMHWTTLERMSGSTQQGDSGAPVAWSPVGTKAIRLWPVPTGGHLLGLLVEQLIGRVASDAEMVIPDAFASPVCASWAAARMWEQHAGVEARMMADRLDNRYREALSEMVATHGTVRWPYLNFAEPDYLSSPMVSVGWQAAY